jgi:RNA polymerase sigma-70 factor (ECF subfamily)
VQVPSLRPTDEGEPRARDAAPPLELGAVYRQHAQRVARWSARLGGPSLDVEDTVQEVFLVVQRLLPEFRGDAELTTWLYRITENVVRHRRRKERIRRWLGGSADEVAGRLASSRPTPAEDVERRDAERLVYAALDGMKHKYRTVIILFELEGLAGEEVAELVGAKVDTVWVWLHRARAQLAERLEKIERTQKGAAA